MSIHHTGRLEITGLDRSEAAYRSCYSTDQGNAPYAGSYRALTMDGNITNSSLQCQVLSRENTWGCPELR